jgi:hypothetical protein
MTTTAEDVLKEALQLSEGERARAAAELLASLEPDVETRDGAAWVAEVERRAQAAFGGRFAPEVPDELAEVVVWYEGKRQGLGDEFLCGS